MYRHTRIHDMHSHTYVIIVHTGVYTGTVRILNVYVMYVFVYANYVYVYTYNRKGVLRNVIYLR